MNIHKATTRIAAAIAGGMLIFAVGSMMPANSGQAWAESVDETADALREASETYEAAVAKQKETAEQIEQVEAELPAKQEKANKAVAAMYREKSPIETLLNAILSSQTLGEFLSVMEYSERIASYQVGLVSDAKQAREQLTAAKAEQDAAVAAAEEAKNTAQEAYDKAVAEQNAKKSSGEATDYRAAGAVGPGSEVEISLSQFKFRGVVNANGWRYTYYSQSVLPGSGLRIPGRHLEDGLVCDGDGYVCVANVDVPKGTVLPCIIAGHTAAKVYDTGCASGTIDIYIA